MGAVSLMHADGCGFLFVRCERQFSMDLFNRWHSQCPLYRGCPLVGGSVMGGSTVVPFLDRIFRARLVKSSLGTRLLLDRRFAEGDFGLGVSKLTQPHVVTSPIEYS